MRIWVVYFRGEAEYASDKYKDAEDRALFLLVLLFNCVVWFKVSTDIYIFFALFLCIPTEKGNEER